MIDDDSPVPLPLRWFAEVSPITLGGLAPLPTEAGIVVRCDRVVACLRREDGSTVWSHALPARSGYGATLLRCGDAIVTDGNDAGEPTTLFGIGLDGAELWRTKLEGRVPDGAVAGSGGQVYAVEHTAPGEDRLVSIDPATGAVISRRELGLGLVGLVAVTGGLIGRRHRVEPDEAGWIALPHGEAPVSIAGGPCVAIAASVERDIMAAVMRDGSDGALTLEVRRASSREPLWSRGVYAPACAVDGDDVAAMADSVAGPCPVVFDAATGAERHQGPAGGGAKTSTIALVGPLLYLESPSEQRIDRRADGETLGACYTSGPPAVDGTRVYFAADDGVLCAMLEV